jgi:hypothetical protein
MNPLSKVVLLLAVTAALTLSAGHAFARSGGGHPTQVKTSGTSTTPSSTTPSGSGGGGSRSTAKPCPGRRYCVTGPRQGITPASGGGGPSRGGVDNPALHPK